MHCSYMCGVVDTGNVCVHLPIPHNTKPTPVNRPHSLSVQCHTVFVQSWDLWLTTAFMYLTLNKVLKDRTP